jgi:hypothetical protein
VFCFAARKKIRNRLQAATEALWIIDSCPKKKHKTCEKSPFNVQMREKDR